MAMAVVEQTGPPGGAESAIGEGEVGELEKAEDGEPDGGAVAAAFRPWLLVHGVEVIGGVVPGLIVVAGTSPEPEEGEAAHLQVGRLGLADLEAGMKLVSRTSDEVSGRIDRNDDRL